MRKRMLGLVAGVLSIAMLACACGGSNNAEPAESTQAGEAAAAEKTVTVAMPSAWSDLYPLGEVSYYDNIIFDQVYDALVKLNGDGSYVGDLAESWEVNEESTEITFKLREGIKWHDGEDFTANDVVSSMKMYGDPAIQSSSRYYLEYIAGCDASGVEESEDSVAVEAVDDATVKVTLKEATFVDTVLDDLTHVYIVADHKIKDLTAEDINKAETWSQPVGTGAFVYADTVDGERMEFTANKDYFRGAPDMDKLVIRVVDSASLLAGLMNGEVDTVLYGGIPLDDWAMAKEQDNLVCEASPSTGYQMLIINSSKPYLTQEVRQALNMAIDRQTLVNQLLQGEGEAIITPICSISPYYNKDVEVTYDPVKAKEMLETAGYPFDQVLQFYVPTGNAVREKAATMIAENLKAVGVQVEILQRDFSAVMEALQNGDDDLGIVGSGGTMNPSESLEMLTGAFNLCKLPDDNELAGLLGKANKLLTFEERQPVFYEYQEKVKEIVPYGYLFTTNNLIAYNKRISNINVDNFGTFNWEIHTWKVSE